MNAARLSHDRMQTRFARATWLLDLAPDRPYQVLAYDEQTQKHLVRYSADAYECQEKLSGPPIRGPDAGIQRELRIRAPQASALCQLMQIKVR